MPLESMRLLSLLILASFLTPLLSGYYEVWFFLLQLGAAVPLFFRLDLEKTRKAWVWRIYSPLALTGCLLAWWWGVSREVAVFWLILCCVVYEYYGERRPRAPVRLLGLLSVLVLVSQFQFDNGLWLALGCSIYLLTLVYCLLSFHLGWEGKDRFARQIGTRWRPTLSQFFACLALALVFFWLLPRSGHVGSGVLPSSRGQSMRAMGQRVTLSDITTLKKSRKHVLDLEPLHGTKPYTPYLKGQCLDSYHNGMWTSTRQREIQWGRRPDGSFRPYGVFESSLPGDLSTVQVGVRVKPFLGNTVFFMDHVVKVKTTTQFLAQKRDMSRLYVPIMTPASLRYEMTCTQEPVRTAQDPDPDVYQQLPESLGALSTYMRQVFPGAETLSDNELARHLEHHLQTNFTYSLQIENMGVEEPVLDFLLHRKRGHCEFFASAMVLCLRSVGISARLVTGFVLPAEMMNGSFYHVTAASAHAWVEAFVDGRWHVFDPTPSSDLPTAGFWERQLAYLNFMWERLVVDWGADSQRDAWDAIKNMWRAALNVLQGLVSRGDPAGLWRVLGAGTVVVLLGWVIGWRMRGRPARRSRTARMLADMERQLARRYRPREGCETWPAYVQGCGFEATTRIELLEWIQDGWKALYGSHGEGAEGILVSRSFDGRYRRLKKRIRRKFREVS